MPATFATPGLVLSEHEFSVPLDHAAPDGERLTVFAREVADPDGRDRPFLVFLQGGPGFEGPRPTGPDGPGWMKRALKDFRVLLLDQRGTGRSTPVGGLGRMEGAEQARYLTHFRADSIVRDCEAIRAQLGSEPWSVLGQSFGGLCAVTYLSLAPEGLREVFITGGVPPLGPGRVDEIYRATFARTVARSRRYYERYPGDRERVLDLHQRLRGQDVRLPGGDRLTSARLRWLGDGLGMSDGAEHLHYLLELDLNSRAFRLDVEAALPFARNPLYAVLHEACWADGGTTNWSAQRVLPDVYAEEPELFTGEHVFPWLFDDVAALAPLRDAAHILAEHEWPRLYDAGRLAVNEVPVAAAAYAWDMYVERAFAEETAEQIRGLRLWITSEYEHNGLRVDGDRVLGRLIDITRGRA